MVICKFSYNQLNRRNITDNQRTYLLGKRYKEEKKKHGGDRKSEDFTKNVEPESKVQNAPLKTSAQKIAEQVKVNPSTVKRAEKFADAVDKVAENTGINPQ
jgi:hypothetical protein